MANQVTEQQLEQFFGTIEQVVAKAVDGLTSHREFINGNCSA
jgi:hypothetical protein